MTNRLRIIKESAMMALAFILPFLLLIILFNANGLSLGEHKNLTMMMIDMQSEYICYLRDLRHILLNGGSLIYTTEKVFGGDYLSIYTFYLSSPFNFFVIFFSNENIPLFFIWSSIIKMSLASLNFYLLARYISKFSYTKLIFALGYGFVSYSFIYMSNYMWLDGVMILPLVVLGIHLLKDKKHYWVYPLAIAYSLLSSWYIGFMICIFSVLYFFCLFASIFSVKNKQFIGFTIRFAVFSLVGGLLSITYWLVAFIHLGGTKGFTEIPPFKFFSLSSVLSGFLENNYAQADLIRQYNSYISMFVGVVPLVFASLYFVNKKFLLRTRIAFLVLVAFYLFMSSNTVTAALLHGGKEPTWFPGRYSFIIGFIICLLGSLSIEEAHDIHPIWYSVPTALGVAVIIIVNSTHHSDRLDKYPLSIPSIIMYFVVVLFSLMVSLANYIKLKPLQNEKVKVILPNLLAMLIAVQIASSYRGADKVIRENKKDNQYQTYETYLKDDKYSRSFEKIKQYNSDQHGSPFYRMEATFNRPGNYNQIDNNPMFYSYSGLSNFSSSSKKEVESYMSKIGFHYNGFFSKYQDGSTYSINSLFGVKYLLEDKNLTTNFHPYFLESNTFEKIDIEDENGVAFYKNNNALSLGFSSDKTSSYFVNEGYRAESGNMYWFNHFEYQNEMFTELDRSIGQDIFKKMTINSITTTIPYETDEFGIRTYRDVKIGDTISINFSTPIKGYGMPLYFSEKNYNSNFNFFIDGYLIKCNTYWNKGIFSFAEKDTHNHTLIIRATKNVESTKLIPELYYEDLSVLNTYIANLKSQEFVVDKIVNKMTAVDYEGHINITNNNKNLLFTLPNETGISVFVDGKKMKSETKMNIFTAIDLSNVSIGEHKVVIQYQDKALVAALPVFFVTLLGFVPLVIYYDKIENLCTKKRKEDK